ncbi:MAG: hypothetical protein QM619_02145 [Micropruina sp.]|uniref:hypothetical protein n=1 Tax=Micropruina sp. TaxID=2737536 RepID=UPI0039E4F864
MIIDTSGSINETDLLAAAQNKSLDLVRNMSVGSTIAVRAMNSDVTAVCTDVIFRLPVQENLALEKKARETNQQAVGVKIPELIACSQKHGSATELFGGLADAFRSYPTSSEAWVFSDLCDTTLSVGGTCKAAVLSDPQHVADSIPDSLTPDLSSRPNIIYIGAGRGSRLDAGSLENLRTVVGLWTKRAGATYEFRTV